MASLSYLDTSAPRLTLTQKIWSINWGLVILLGTIGWVEIRLSERAAPGATL